MKISNGKQKWSQPAITSVERMKNAAGGSHTGVPKGASLAEFIYDGPGS